MEAIIPNGDVFFAPANHTPAAYDNAAQAKASAGVLYTLSGFNSGPAQFIHVYDSAALPAGGAVPSTVLYAAAASNFFIDYGTHGKAFPRGIAVGNSSTGPTKTLAAADCWFDPVFK